MLKLYSKNFTNKKYQVLNSEIWSHSFPDKLWAVCGAIKTIFLSSNHCRSAPFGEKEKKKKALTCAFVCLLCWGQVPVWVWIWIWAAQSLPRSQRHRTAWPPCSEGPEWPWVSWLFGTHFFPFKMGLILIALQPYENYGFNTYYCPNHNW